MAKAKTIKKTKNSPRLIVSFSIALNDKDGVDLDGFLSDLDGFLSNEALLGKSTVEIIGKTNLFNFDNIEVVFK